MKKEIVLGLILASVMVAMPAFATLTTVILANPSNNDTVYGNTSLLAFTDDIADSVTFYYSNDPLNYTQNYIGNGGTTDGLHFYLVWDSSNVTDGVYSFTAITNDSSISNTSFNVTVNNIPPAPESVTPNWNREWASFTWTWPDSTYNDAAFFYLYRNNQSIATHIWLKDVTIMKFIDAPLDLGTTYTYKIGAQYYPGLGINNSSEVTITTNTFTCPDCSGSSGGSSGGSSSTLTINRVMMVSYPSTITIPPGKSGTTKVTVHNEGEASFVNTIVSLSGIPTSWYTIIPAKAFIATNTSYDFSITFSIPEGETGSKPMTMTTTSGVISGSAPMTLVIGEGTSTPEVTITTPQTTQTTPSGYFLGFPTDALVLIVAAIGIVGILAAKFKGKIFSKVKDVRKPSYSPRRSGGFLGS
jgi:hypothetical protein